MTFPAVAATNSGNSGANTTSTVITMPTGATVGDLVVVVFGKDGTGVPSIASGTGWTQVGGASTGSSYGVIFWKVFDGSGDNLTITTTSEGTCYTVYRITGHNGQVNISSPQVSAGTTPNPANLDPADWGTEDTLWISACAWDGNVAHSAYPTNYASNQLTNRWANSNGCGVASATRNLNAGSEDPGTFTIGSDEWWALTIAIRPQQAATVERSAAIGATVDVASAASFFSIFSRSAAIDAVAAVAAAGVNATIPRSIATINSSTDGVQFLSGSSSLIEAGDGLVAFIDVERSTSDPELPSAVSGWGLTWTRITDVIWTTGAATNRRMAAYKAFAAAAPGSGNLQVDFTNTHIGCEADVIRIPNSSPGVIANSATNSAGSGTTASATLAAAADAANRELFAMALNAQTIAITPRTNWTEVNELTHGAPTITFETQYRWDTFETSASATWTGGQIWGCIALEVNLTAGAVVERSAAIDAAVAVASSGVGFTVFERSAAVGASVAVASVPQRALIRSAAVDAAVLIASSAQFLSIFSRSVVVDAAVAVAVTPQRDLLRSAAVGAAISVDTSAEFLTEFERAAVVDAAVGIASSGEALVIHERSAAVNASISVAAVPQRELIRSAVVDAAPAVTVADFERTLLRSAAVGATVSVASDGFGVLERSTSVSAAVVVASTPQRELLRSSAVDTLVTVAVQNFQRDLLRSAAANVTAAITVSDFERDLLRAAAVDAAAAVTVSDFERELLRSAAVSATATVSVAGEISGIVQRSAAVGAVVTVSAAHQRELLRQVSLDAAVLIVSSGVRPGLEVERSAAINTVVSLEAAGEFFTVHERSATVGAIVAPAASGHTVRERSASISSSLNLVVFDFQRELQRSSAIAVAAVVSAAGRTFVFERRGAITVVAGVLVRGVVIPSNAPRRPLWEREGDRESWDRDDPRGTWQRDDARLVWER